MKKIIQIIAFALLLSACGKYEYTTFNKSFISFEGASNYTVSCQATVVNTYFLRVSSKPLKEPLEVELDVKIGDGLTSEADYKLMTGNKLTFLPGVYTLPFRIQWLPKEIDESKDNSITINIKSCSKSDVIIGMPGPDAIGRQIKIRKIK